MAVKIIFLLLVIVSPVFGFTKIPETISVGEYSVSLQCDERWSVQVFAKKGVIVYSFVDEDAKGVAFQITVYRMQLPAAAAESDPAALADRLVRDDGFRFKRSMFKTSARLAHAPEIVTCPAGVAYVYAEDRASFSDMGPHYARAALLLPGDFRARRVCYLVVGHQAGGGLVRQEQAQPFTSLLRSIRESSASQPAQPTAMSATPPPGQESRQQ